MRARHSPYPMISFDSALDIVLQASTRLGIDKKPLDAPQLVGSTIAQDVTAQESVPSYRASIVDGYAVYVEDGVGVFPVAAVSVAGPDGAPVPEGANAVVMVEDTSLVSSSPDGAVELQVEIKYLAQAGENIRPIGCDIQLGQTVLKAGQTITAVGGEVGLLASVGQTEIAVHRKPTVAILSTGNELVPVSTPGPLSFGSIRDSNRPALKQVIESHGFQVVDLGIAPDTVDAISRVIKDGLARADVLVTTGGVSMGELDLLKPTIERNLGGKIHFGRVALKPGKPTTFATIPAASLGTAADKLVFALPGNPVSALVTFQLFVLPCLKKMSGSAAPTAPCLKVKVRFTDAHVQLGHDIRLDPRPEFYRVTLSQSAGESHWIAHGTGSQLSSRVLSMASAAALLRLPVKSQDVEVLKQGSFVDAMLIL
ncbi:hypothetical protein HDU91_002582 [Kappamyces sp. JEL0680]|nr:hypothetical protein HDU91_002582 [Kappamyces sp. JEL0680]